jgi:two-component system, cell cycle sensor histidine kinase and response regulator CckA
MISESKSRKEGREDQRRQLEESERELADFFENASVGLHWVGPEGTILRANQAELDLLGYAREEYVGRHIGDFHVDRAVIDDILCRLNAGEVLSGCEARLRAKDGSIRNVLISSSVYRVDGKFIHTRCVTQDVTARRQAEERMRQSAKMEAIGQLAGGLAHDFNNQLHALSGLIDFVAMDPGLSEASQNDLAEIQNTTERMASLTRQLLAFSRQQVLIPETIDLNAAVLETKPMLQRLVGSNLEMRLELASDPKWVKVDRSQLLQVLMNLVINARDAMPHGGQVVLRTSLQQVLGRELDSVARGPVLPGTYARLTVEDWGSGIAREDLTRIFDAFFTTKPVGEGTGLGLATVDGILSQSRGHIWAESEGKVGATFHVLLPLAPTPTEPVSPVLAPPITTQRQGRLLVVDDEAMVREVIVRTLANHGYEVHQAIHGDDALRQLNRLKPQIDLVVSDVVMPVMGGAELALKLTELYPEMPIIWMSGYPRETVIGRGRLGEEQPFLQKPVPPTILLETVAKALRSRTAQSQAR